MPPCTIKTHPKSCSNYIDYIGRNQKKLTLVGISSAQLHHFIFILIPIELIIALYYNQPIYYFIIRHISTTLKENDHMTHFFDTTRNIYQALNDEISKELSQQPPVQLVVCYKPSKGLCYYSPQRTVSQAFLLVRYKAVLLESSFPDSSACSFIYFCTASSVILPIVST